MTSETYFEECSVRHNTSSGTIFGINGKFHVHDFFVDVRRRDVHAGSSDMNDEKTIFEQRSLGKVAYGPRLIWKRCLCAILYSKKLPLSKGLGEKLHMSPGSFGKVAFEPNSTGKSYL